MALIKNNRIVRDKWHVLRKAELLPESGPVLVSWAVWCNRRSELVERGGLLGVMLESDDPVEPLLEDLSHLNLIAVNFPGFSDGRGFSTARLLRERHGFTGELRAAGYVIRDQVSFLKRCGFDAFEFSDSASLAPWEQLEHEISIQYQPTGDHKPTAIQLRHRLAAAE